MKTFYKINLIGLLLGLLFYLLIDFIFNEYVIQQALNLSKNAFSIFSSAFYLLILVSITVIVPISINRWLNGTKLSLLLVLLWIPYTIMWLMFFVRFFPGTVTSDENNYGAGLIGLFLIIFYPIYILFLCVVGIFLNGIGKGQSEPSL